MLRVMEIRRKTLESRCFFNSDYDHLNGYYVFCLVFNSVTAAAFSLIC